MLLKKPVINKKYKELAKSLHPDTPTGDVEKFKQLKYSFLRTPVILVFNEHYIQNILIKFKTKNKPILICVLFHIIKSKAELKLSQKPVNCMLYNIIFPSIIYYIFEK